MEAILRVQDTTSAATAMLPSTAPGFFSIITPKTFALT